MAIFGDQGRRAGHTYSQPDLIIAATAMEQSLIVVTRDRRDFDRAGALVLNPWEQVIPLSVRILETWAVVEHLMDKVL